jgi:hypothetical protein
MKRRLYWLYRELNPVSIPNELSELLFVITYCVSAFAGGTAENVI